jgi:hypothetical protein
LLPRNALQKQAVDLQKNAIKVLKNAQIVFATKKIKVQNPEDDLLQNMVENKRKKENKNKKNQNNIKTIVYIL